MKQSLIIHEADDETQIALLEDSQLVEYHREKKSHGFIAGDMYLGKVKKVMPGLNAAFLDIGHEKDAFLHYYDLGPQFLSLKKFVNLRLQGKSKDLTLNDFVLENDISKDGSIDHVVKKGDILLVKIAKESISNKGPRLTAELSLPGRYLVLIPFSDKISISQKIKDTYERNRLLDLAKAIKPKNFGMIIRTVAEKKTTAELQQDLQHLLDRWNEMALNLQNAKAPVKILSELNKSSALIRDLLNPNFHEIITDSKEIYREIEEYIKVNAPGREEILKLYNHNTPVFDYFGIEKQIKALFGKTVYLPGGGYLIIEHTEALHVVDVNSGHLGRQKDDHENIALKVNLEAAKEIARQLRLRDMGGIIVVDFIDMKEENNRLQLFQYLKECMKNDKAKHTILPPSKFGLVEITRQRVRPEVEIKVDETCPCCHGQGHIAPSLLIVEQLEQTLRFLSLQSGHKKLTVFVHPFIEAYLNRGFFSNIRRKWQKQMKCKIKIKGITSMPLVKFRIFDKHNEEVIL